MEKYLCHTRDFGKMWVWDENFFRDAQIFFLGDGKYTIFWVLRKRIFCDTQLREKLVGERMYAVKI